MAYKFSQCFNEAKRVGLQTPQGQELLKQASRIKAMYDAYRQRQQSAQGFEQGGATSNTGDNTAGTPTNARSPNGTPNNNMSSNIQNLLTPQQNEAYGRLIQTSNENGEKIKGEYTYLKKQIEILDGEIKKRQGDPATVKQLEINKAEILNKLRGFSASYLALNQKLREDKKSSISSVQRQILI